MTVLIEEDDARHMSVNCSAEKNVEFLRPIVSLQVCLIIFNNIYHFMDLNE